MAIAYRQTNSRGQDYFLHGRLVTLKGGRQQQIYYFAKNVRDEDAIAELPAGKEVTENQRTGLLILRGVKK